jgi:hypothetical protein
MASDVAWDELVVSDEEFAALRAKVEATAHEYRINWLGHETLDGLYVMVFPDGTLTIPSGGTYRFYGDFLAVPDLDELLRQVGFDAGKHQSHAEGWQHGSGSLRPPGTKEPAR